MTTLVWYSTYISRAGRMYSSKTGEFETLPEDFYIEASGEPTKKGVPYNADFKDVLGFSDKIDLVKVHGDIEPGDIENLEDFLKGFGYSEFNYRMKNIEGKQTAVISPSSRFTKHPKSQQVILRKLQKKGNIEDFSCIVKGGESLTCLIEL